MLKSVMLRLFLWWHGRHRSRNILVAAYELTLLALLGASLGLDKSVETESIILALLLFIPVVIPRVSSLSLPMFGGSATVQFKEIQDRIESQGEKVQQVSHSAETAVNSLTAHLLAPQPPGDLYRRYVGERIEEQKVIVVGSEAFTEGRLLCAIVTTLLKKKATGFHDVIPKYDYGNAALNFISLQLEQIDIYATYTWSGFEMSVGPSLKHIGPRLRELPEKDAIDELNEIYGALPQGLTWLSPLGFENNWEMVMLKDEADKREISQISHLGDWAGQMRLGCDYEFFAREAGYRALQLHGIRCKEVKCLQRSEVYEALANREVDIIDGFTTDPEITQKQLLCLANLQHILRRYCAVLVARTQFIERNPEVKAALESLTGTIGVEEMRRMIRQANRVEEDDTGAFERIALDFLDRQRLVG